jgi:hypothetical protein
MNAIPLIIVMRSSWSWPARLINPYFQIVKVAADPKTDWIQVIPLFNKLSTLRTYCLAIIRCRLG